MPHGIESETCIARKRGCGYPDIELDFFPLGRIGGHRVGADNFIRTFGQIAEVYDSCQTARISPSRANTASPWSASNRMCLF